MNVHVKKFLIGAGIAVAGALLTYGTEFLGGVDFGDWTPVVVAGWSALVQAVRKALQAFKEEDR